jgi:hypothetical protein
LNEFTSSSTPGAIPTTDYIIVITTHPGSFLHHTIDAKDLRQHIIKMADSTAWKLREVAAAHNPVAAVYEVVVGIHPGTNAVMVLLSDLGLERSPSHVRGISNMHCKRTHYFSMTGNSKSATDRPGRSLGSLRTMLPLHPPLLLCRKLV